ncbi:MAG: hypothetical protein WC404_00205 [Candidatus Omnitrophota bacterium]|jgi:hypothetical protein
MKNLIQEKLQTLTLEQRKQLYRDVFETEQGKLALEDLKNRSYVKVSIEQEGGDNNLFSLGAREGRRQVILHIETMIEETKPEDTVAEE